MILHIWNLHPMCLKIKDVRSPGTSYPNRQEVFPLIHIQQLKSIIRHWVCDYSNANFSTSITIVQNNFDKGLQTFKKALIKFYNSQHVLFKNKKNTTRRYFAKYTSSDYSQIDFIRIHLIKSWSSDFEVTLFRLTYHRQTSP